MAKALSKKIKDSLIRQGKDILLPFLDVTGLGWSAEVDLDDAGIVASITFTNMSKKSVVISQVWFDEKTGDILQYGSNYGYLVL